ncbi:protein serine/threonine phosphatase 2C [Trametes sanguinea]|nr:protein serine/threonine phosphatase 2C [Trametes sanguinea]
MTSTTRSGEEAAPKELAFSCAVLSMKGPRDSMEDAHSIVVPFAGVHGQGLFAIFDGHGGKKAAKWCSRNFPRCLLGALRENKSAEVVDALKAAFQDADAQLEQQWAESDGKMDSGTTAVVAFLRVEDASGEQSFLPSDYDPLGTAVPSARGSTIKRSGSDDVFTPPANACSRVLYCANVGDARAVLCRGGKAARLTYDHTTQDKKEVERIENEGGVISEGRVDGRLIPTRALGDAEYNQYVIGTPYTTEMEITKKDEFVILACDGLWDVMEDQEAVDLVRGTEDPAEAAQMLLNEAKRRHTSDNVTVLLVRLRDPPKNVGVE